MCATQTTEYRVQSNLTFTPKKLIFIPELLLERQLSSGLLKILRLEAELRLRHSVLEEGI